MDSTRRNESCDVLVVGGGSAAFESAVAASEAGAGKVVMLEKAPRYESGGNSRFSSTCFRFAHNGAEEIRGFLPQLDNDTFARMSIPPYRTYEFFADLDRLTRGRIDPELATTLVEESNAALHWMLEVGIEFEPAPHAEINGQIVFTVPGEILGARGDGLGQLARWQAAASKRNINVRYESRVTGLIGSGAEGIERVLVSDPQGEYGINASAVILCSGGFQANPDMRARHLGEHARRAKIRGSKHDTGEVTEFALNIGAAKAGQWDWAHMTPVAADAPDVGSDQLETLPGSGIPDAKEHRQMRYGYQFGITVNSDGERFFDEGYDYYGLTYAQAGWHILNQPGSSAFQIFDQDGLAHVDPTYQPRDPIQADSLQGLAEKIGIDPTRLGETVRRFNESASSDRPFDPAKIDGRTTIGLDPPKSNWALPIGSPPFAAFPVAPGITFTFGGLNVSRSAEVLATSGDPIPGLYAVGDIMGLFHFNYPACSGQTRNVVFARRAAAHAMSRMAR